MGITSVVFGILGAVAFLVCQFVSHDVGAWAFPIAAAFGVVALVTGASARASRAGRFGLAVGAIVMITCALFGVWVGGDEIVVDGLTE